MSEHARKILWIFSSFGVDAPNRRYTAVMNRMGPRHEHVICALDQNTGAEALLEPETRWRAVEPARKRGSGFSLGAMWSSRKTLKAERPDLLVTVGLGAGDWLTVNRGPGAAPHIHFEDPVGPGEAIEGTDGAQDWARRQTICARNRAFVAEGEHYERLLTKRWGAPASSVKRMPWGVDLTLVKPVERPERPRDGAPVVIGSLTPLVAEKRHDRLLRVLATLLERGRHVELRLVGEGPEQSRLQALAESLEVADRVAFIPRDGLDPAVAAEETAQIDLYADLSDACHSPAGPTLALAAGLPILAARDGAAGRLASAPNAPFIRPFEDESALAASAEILVSDGALRREIGVDNRAAAVERHDVDAMVGAYHHLFEAVAGADKRLMLPAPKSANGVLALAAPRAQEPVARPPRARPPIPNPPAPTPPVPRIPVKRAPTPTPPGAVLAGSPQQALNGVAPPALASPPQPSQELATQPSTEAPLAASADASKGMPREQLADRVAPTPSEADASFAEEPAAGSPLAQAPLTPVAKEPVSKAPVARVPIATPPVPRPPQPSALAPTTLRPTASTAIAPVATPPTPTPPTPTPPTAGPLTSSLGARPASASMQTVDDAAAMSETASDEAPSDAPMTEPQAKATQAKATPPAPAPLSEEAAREAAQTAAAIAAPKGADLSARRTRLTPTALRPTVLQPTALRPAPLNPTPLKPTSIGDLMASMREPTPAGAVASTKAGAAQKSAAQDTVAQEVIAQSRAVAASRQSSQSN
ncbi:MAG: glycosyltransferase [Pseudomonadota bacterium]